VSRSGSATDGEETRTHPAPAGRRGARVRHDLTAQGEVAIDENLRDEISARNEELAASGLRVLALASKHARSTSVEELSGLVFPGFAGMMDPPAAGVRETIDKFRRAGIRTVMVTGDQKLTAAAVGRELGLLGAGQEILTQLVLGVDRDSELLASLFNERDEAVRRMIALAIRGAHAAGRKIGICRQGPERLYRVRPLPRRGGNRQHVAEPGCDRRDHASGSRAREAFGARGAERAGIVGDLAMKEARSVRSGATVRPVRPTRPESRHRRL
jgi:hypothetical protein